MAIPLVKEPDDVCFGVIEVCHFCRNGTRYWHQNTNNPVCTDCAKTHKVGELPDYGKIIRAARRRLALST